MDVLVVEDDDGMAEALQQMLGLHGYDTRHSGTGTAALADLPGTSLVLLDLSLPDLVSHEVSPADPGELLRAHRRAQRQRSRTGPGDGPVRGGRRLRAQALQPP